MIGPSSTSRKSTALRYAGYTVKPYEEKLKQADKAAYEARTMILNGATLSMLVTYLAQNPCRLFVHNELSGWLHEMNKSFNSGYKQVVTEIYDGVDRANTNRERTELIINPALSIAAASTDVWLYKSLTDQAEQQGGFLQRMLFYVVRNVKEEEVDLTFQPGNGLEQKLATFDETYFQWWRKLRGSHCLELSAEACVLRNKLYPVRWKQYFSKNNDALMSYFTRIYDGYWFKLCILITLAKYQSDLRESVELDCACPPRPQLTSEPIEWEGASAFFESHSVDVQTAEQAFYLCDFYMKNTIPLLEIMDEQDKLAGERKVVGIILNKFSGKAKHSELMNSCHMRKREFNDCMMSLIEREAVSMETYGSDNHRGRMYVLDPGIMEDWSK